MKYCLGGFLTLFFITNLFSNPIIVHSEDFNDCAAVTWQNIAASADNDAADQWSCSASPGTYLINGAGGGADEDWLVSPVINMDEQAGEYLIFEYFNDFDGADIEWFYSTDFSGNYTTADLENATWNTIEIDPYDIGNDTYISNFLPHAAIDISMINGTNVYFALKYSAGGNVADSRYWEIDNIKILADYYGLISNTETCEDLKTSLFNLIDSHNVIEYTSSDFDVWDSQFVTDLRLNDNSTTYIVKDRYSEIPGGAEPYEFTHGLDRDQGGNVTEEGLFYNREHVFPRSWWGGGNTPQVDTQYTDIHILVPADKFVNLQRSNFPMAEVGIPDETFLNSSQLGPSITTGYTETVFEPIDEYKGDFARIFLYMAVRYEDQIDDWETLDSRGDDVLNGDPYLVYEDWYRDLLISWHNADAVSDEEKDRNNAIFSIQGNRNPFVDHPEYVDAIWVDPCVPLGVSLTAFIAKQIEEEVLLEWSTSSETNNAYFEMEHSLDGVDFESLGRVEGKGNSTVLQEYQHLHRSPAFGYNYYRLRQFDFDGTMTVSGIESIYFEKDKSIRFYPNPVNDVLFIENSTSGGILSYAIKNNLGKTINKIESSDPSIEINLEILAEGLYFIEVWSADRFVKILRFVKI